jgi:uncharacterized protein (DUF885 family)
MTEPPHPSAGDALGRLAERAWDDYVAAEPVYATSIGDRRFNDRLPPNDADALDRDRVRLSASQADTRAIDPRALSAEERVTRAALLDFLAYQLGLAASGVTAWSIDPLDGPQVSFLNVPSFQPIETEAEGRAALARWRDMGPWVDRHVDRLRASAGRGLIAPACLIDRVAGELDDLLARPVDDWPLVAPARTDRPDWPPAAAATFRTDLRAAVEDGLRPAFGRYRAALIDEFRPIARSDDRPGLSHVPGGADAYASLVRAHTSLGLNPESIHDIGLAETARIDAEFEELGTRLLGRSALPDVLTALRNDPRLRFETSDEVVTTAGSALDRATAAVPGWFGRVPRTPCEVVVMAPHESKHSTIAYYRSPAADGSRPGQYYINVSEPATRPRYEAEVLAFHEAVPGHHLQLAIAQELHGLPAFRRFGGPTAYIEGWGLYSERLSAEMGLLSGELDAFGILSFDAWRASRLVVDTGMHALGWSRGLAIDFMTAHTALAPNNIANEVDRYLAMPGQALAYKLGQLELLRLRATASQTLGSAFDIRAFHDLVLGGGAIGLTTLRGVVDDWIEQTRAG